MTAARQIENRFDLIMCLLLKRCSTLLFKITCSLHISFWAYSREGNTVYSLCMNQEIEEVKVLILKILELKTSENQTKNHWILTVIKNSSPLYKQAREKKQAGWGLVLVLCDVGTHLLLHLNLDWILNLFFHLKILNLMFSLLICLIFQGWVYNKFITSNSSSKDANVFLRIFSMKYFLLTKQHLFSFILRAGQ